MKELVRYQCEICKTEWRFRKLAEFCERFLLPPLPFKKGDEVRLRNRNTGYTLAVVEDIFVCTSQFVVEPANQEILLRIMSHFETATYHTYAVYLDREVFLDHKWEGRLQIIDPIYILKEEEAAGMLRDDNNAY